MAASDDPRLSVLIVDVHTGRERDFLVLARRLKEALESKRYAQAETIRDEAVPSRFYAVRHWLNAEAVCSGSRP